MDGGPYLLDTGGGLEMNVQHLRQSNQDIIYFRAWRDSAQHMIAGHFGVCTSLKKVAFRVWLAAKWSQVVYSNRCTALVSSYMASSTEEEEFYML